MDFHEQDLFLPEEEDAFYSEMRKQLLHLTEDDEEGGGAIYVDESYYYLWPGKVAYAPQVTLQRPVTGTGVFIPQASQGKPRNRSRRKNSKARKQKQMEKKN